VIDLSEYRAKALGLLLQWSGLPFQNVACEVYWERAVKPRWIEPLVTETVKWTITAKDLKAEQQRQGSDRVDLVFCLRWHAHWAESIENPAAKFGTIKPKGPPRDAKQVESLDCALALAHLLLLESLELIGEDGCMTVLGDVLKDVKADVQESCLFALELLKFGVLTDQPFEEAEDRHFPQAMQYPTQLNDENMRAVLLISRIMSLRPMQLQNSMWDAHVDFDLAAFHSTVRVLKRTLREITEASLANVVLQNSKLMPQLPACHELFSPSSQARMPTFTLPRTCMGVVWKQVLMSKSPGDVHALKKRLQKEFPCCQDAVGDLRKSLASWDEVRRCVDAIAEPLGALDFKASMDRADAFLQARVKQVGL
jgi:hypothetical protein